MGMVFNIQRFSIHDGPGIRTTVFLKGCPLRCVWCHNPESYIAYPQVQYLSSRCTGCGLCVERCPAGALLPGSGAIVRDRDKCTGCLSCADCCPEQARQISGLQMSPGQLVQELLKDRVYYKRTGGGVTFSGGEPLLQPDFVVQCARLLKEQGIHTAMESSLYASQDALRAVIPYIDYFMCDLKGMDEQAHIRFTGVSNRRILDNTVLLSQLGAHVLIRIPIVAGFNDSEENMERTARFLTKNTSFRQAELLAVHKLAQHKYISLDMEYTPQSIPLVQEERMEQLRDVLRSCGIEVKAKQ